MATASTTEPPPAEWAFVQELLRDIQADEEDREQLAYFYGQWRLSMRVFRRVEARRMMAIEPTGTDLLFHKACVTELMSVGTLLQIAAQEHDDEELASCGIRRDVLEALLQDLHNTFDEWHAQIPESRIEALSSAIFDASPELNLSAPRA